MKAVCSRHQRCREELAIGNRRNRGGGNGGRRDGCVHAEGDAQQALEGARGMLLSVHQAQEPSKACFWSCPEECCASQGFSISATVGGCSGHASAIRQNQFTRTAIGQDKTVDILNVVLIAPCAMGRLFQKIQLFVFELEVDLVSMDSLAHEHRANPIQKSSRDLVAGEMSSGEIWKLFDT